MKIAVIGATGMVGHVLFHELQKKNIDVIGIGRRQIEKDILKFDLFIEWEQIKKFLQDGKFNIIINCSAILVNDSNLNRMQAAYINSLLPHLLADIFKTSDTKIIHLSTGGVFSGNDEFYFEDSLLSPQTYYGITKAAGEFSNDKDLIIRSDFWGPDNRKEGAGLFNWILNKKGIAAAYTNVFFNGISNIELARIILNAIDNVGILHIGTSNKISKCNFLEKIKTKLNLEDIILSRDDTVHKNIFLKSKRKIPNINDFDVMIKDICQYLIYNREYYANIYPQIYKDKF